MEEKTKKCRVCGRELPLTAFSKNRRERDGLNRRCKECDNAYQRAYNARKEAEKASIPLVQRNHKFADKTPRELQDMLRELKAELIARGFNCEVNLTYLQKIEI